MKITTKDDVRQLGTILGIWAHPDDETWTSAGLMAMAADNGQAVFCITATYGEEGIQDPSRWPADKLATIRKHELDAACKVIGVKKHFYLGYRDGQCSKCDTSEAIRQIVQIIDDIKPASILTFGPSGTTGHIDHITVSGWATQACQQSKLATKPTIYHSVHSKEWYERSGKRLGKQFNIFFNIEQPPLVPEASADITLTLNRVYCERKQQALKAQPSQTTNFLQKADPEHIRDLTCVECFIRVD